jgi:xanthine dehydrogenase YagR molybdenum-binding subunit
MIEMNAPIGDTPLDHAPNGILGKPMDRVDGPLKVTGTAVYSYEVRDAPNPAYGFLVTASIGKGRIRAIDTSAAEQSPGVIKVLTHQNVPAQGIDLHRKACPVLTSPEVNYYGQPVAFVIAEQFEQARAAAYLVQITYDTAPGHFAMAAHAGNAVVPQEQQGSPVDTSNGDFAKAFAAAAVKLDATYTTPLQSHTMMEPHATIAMWEGDKLTLFTANQMPNKGQDAVAKTLKMPKEKVRLVSRYIGGGFGAKLWVNPDAMLAALGARAINRPVKVALTRQQVFHVTTHRSDTVQRVQIGADENGKILAIGHDAISGNLAGQIDYEAAADQTRSLYAGENRQTRHRLVPLDIPIASSMRAPGEAVGLLALECAMDELAEKLRIDPIDLRIRNEPGEDPTKHIPYSTRNLVPCMKEGAERFGWSRRNPQPGQTREGRWLIGMGMAAATRGNPLQPSKASVRIDANGTATARMAMTDIGTGTYTIMTQIAAEMLGLPPDRVHVEMGDTDYPMASGSGGSFGAASAGSALYDACTNLRTKLAQAAGIDPQQAVFANGSISGGGKQASLASLAGAAGLSADGGIEPGKMKKAYSQQSYGAHFVEVAVDMDTGEVRIRRMLGVFSAGRILNAKTARSQAIGGMTFGIGAALQEQVVLDDRFGYFVNHDMAEYHVPVHADVPEIDAVFIEEVDNKTNPLKSKGLGELGICGAGAAVANAIYNACGVRVRDYPITLDKIIAKLPVDRSAL